LGRKPNRPVHSPAWAEAAAPAGAWAWGKGAGKGAEEARAAVKAAVGIGKDRGSRLRRSFPRSLNFLRNLKE